MPNERNTREILSLLQSQLDALNASYVVLRNEFQLHLKEHHELKLTFLLFKQSAELRLESQEDKEQGTVQSTTAVRVALITGIFGFLGSIISFLMH